MSSTMYLILGAALVFAAFTLALILIGVVSVERRGVARSVGAIQALDARPRPARSRSSSVPSPSA